MRYFFETTSKLPYTFWKNYFHEISSIWASCDQINVSACFLKQIKKIEQASQNTKTQGMLKQHKAVWMKELAHLHSLRRKNTADIDLHTKHGMWYVSVFFIPIMIFSGISCQVRKTIHPCKVNGQVCSRDLAKKAYQLWMDIYFWKYHPRAGFEPTIYRLIC